MDLSFTHTQTKKDRKSNATSSCNLLLFQKDDLIEYQSRFHLQYSRYGSKKDVTFEHGLQINLTNGNIYVSYRIVNDNLTEDNIYKTSYKSKRNDFKMLSELIDNGIYRGEKRLNYWGIKYERAINEISLMLTNVLKSKFNTNFYITKSYKEKPSVNEIFDIIVDFHLYKKNIKGHDNVYYDIMYVYPLKKYLKLNENKFLPSVLDSLKIKSGYLIKELNTSETPINISGVNYICKLFGENYLEYIKKINLTQHCSDINIPKIKPQELKNESEKNCFVKLINSWGEDAINIDSIFVGINKVLTLRNHIESLGIVIPLTPKNDNQFMDLIERLTNLKQYYKRGYKLKYNFPENFLNDIQTEIHHENKTFKVKVLITEEDFINEGSFMKNCMAKQYNNGTLYVYLRGTLDNKHINLQYRKGGLVQSYGKSNTQVPSIFQPFIELLNEKFKKFNDMIWTKEKYDFLFH